MEDLIERRTLPQACRRALSGLAIAAFTLSACSPSVDEATEVPVTDPDAASEVAPSSSPTTAVTVDPTTTSTTEPTDPLSVHVAPNGDDAAPGTEGSPFASVSRALDIVEPGATIHLHAGSYEPLVIDGAQDLTITSVDDDSVVIAGTGYQGHGVLVTNSDGFRLEGVSVKTVLWGVWIESSVNVELRSNTIEDLGQEGIMVKRNSSDVLIVDNTIRSTGQRPGENRGRPFANFGEGIYVGNAGPLDDGTRDQSNNVTIRGNEIHSTTAEAIDIKPWAHSVLIEGNLIYDVDTATSGAVVVGIGDDPSPANDIVIRGNVIHSVTRTSTFDHGNAIVISSPAVVTGNVIWDVQHYGILIDRRLGSTVGGDVLVANNLIAGTGLDSIAQLSESPNIIVTIGDNLTGQTAWDLLGATPTLVDAWAAVESLSAR